MMAFVSRCLTLVAAGLLISAPAMAQENFPEEPVFVVVPYPPGGPNDMVTRSITEELSKELGQPIVVDNRGGAGGNVGTEYMVASDADGYTLALHGMSLVVNPLLYATTRYDPVADVSGIGMVAEAPLVLVVPADFPAKNVEELIAYLREHPGEVNLGSGGAGTSLHLAAVQFMDMTDTDMMHIPYKGNAMVMPDLLSGKIGVLFSSIGTAQPHIESGALRALGVTTAVRSEILSDVPTIAEAGLPSFEFGAWYALVAPKTTPEPIRERLNAALNIVLEKDAVKSKLGKLGYRVTPRTLAEADAFISGQFSSWSDLIEKSGITAN